jgi:hypothetical protein
MDHPGWALSAAKMDEVRKIPVEYWAAMVSGGPDTLNWFYDYLEEAGYTAGLPRDAFETLARELVQYGGLDGLMSSDPSERTSVVSKTGENDFSAKPVWEPLKQGLDYANAPKGPPAQQTPPPSPPDQVPVEDDPNKEDKDKDKDDNEEDAQGITREELAEILKTLFSEGLGPNSSGVVNSPLTGPTQLTQGSSFDASQSFQQPFVGGAIGGNPIVAPGRSAGPSYSAPMVGVPTPTNPHATMTADEWIKSIIGQLEALYPDMFGDGDPSDPLAGLWDMNQQQYDLLLKWWNDESYRAYWEGGDSPLGYNGAYEFLVAQGFINPDNLSKEDFAAKVYPLLQANGPQYLLDEGWVTIRPRNQGEENTDPFPEGSIPENVPIVSMRSDALQIIYNWLLSTDPISSYDLSSFDEEMRSGLKPHLDGTIRDFWLLDTNGDSSYRVFVNLGFIDPMAVTPSIWQRLWRERLYPLFKEGPMAFYNAVQAGELNDVLAVSEPGPDAPELLDPFEVPDQNPQSGRVNPFVPEEMPDGNTPWVMTQEGLTKVLGWMNSPDTHPELWLANEPGEIFDWFLEAQGMSPGNAGYIDLYATGYDEEKITKARTKFIWLWNSVIKPSLSRGHSSDTPWNMADALYGLVTSGHVVVRDPYIEDTASPLVPVFNADDVDIIDYDPDTAPIIPDPVKEDVSSGEGSSQNFAGGLGADRQQADVNRAFSMVQGAQDSAKVQIQEMSPASQITQEDAMGQPGYVPGQEGQKKPDPAMGQQSAPPTAMPSPSSTKGQPDGKQMGQQVQDLQKGLAQPGPGSPLAGGVSQGGTGSGLGPSGRGMFSGR